MTIVPSMASPEMLTSTSLEKYRKSPLRRVDLFMYGNIRIIDYYLDPVHKMMKAELLQFHHVHCDETPFTMPEHSKEYMWVFHSPEDRLLTLSFCMNTWEVEMVPS